MSPPTKLLMLGTIETLAAGWRSRPISEAGKGGTAANHKVTWGAATRTYSAAQLAAGVNLADEFPVNPFSEAFRKVDEAILAKQTYETMQVKTVFHSKEAKADFEAAVKRTEVERAPLIAAVQAAFVPVTHTIKVEP